MWKDEIKLAFGHSILGIAPKSIDLEKFNQARIDYRKHSVQDGLESFGLFNTASPNFSQYYPDVKAEDLVPQDGDYVRPIFRALSEVVVHKSWNPVDFGEGGALKKSMSLLKGQTIYPNHEAVVGNELGAVSNVSWEESYKQDGITIPAGINSELMIDAKSNPKIARAVMAPIPSVHSTSVTVQFMWEKSHAAMTEEQFFSKLGTYDKDGKLIRRIASKIMRYNEISLVSHGADPFAQKVTKDGINNPKHADATYRLSAEAVKERKAQNFFFFDFKEDLISNSESTIPSVSNITENSLNENTPNMDKKMIAFLTAMVATMGLTIELKEGEEISDEQQSAITNKLTEISNAATAAANDKIELERLQALETKLKADEALLTETAALKAKQAASLVALKERVKANYMKLSENKPDTTILGTLDNGDEAVLNALNSGYETQLEAKFPLTCDGCGKTSLSRKSSGGPETSNSTSLEELKRKKQSNGFNLHSD